MKNTEIILKLEQTEEKVIVEGLAMMTYNPSIGRILSKGGISTFVKIMVKKIAQLKEINSQDEFDEWHRSVVETIQKEIKTNKGESPSYGQAQKPLNVFLKVYVDWANLPHIEKAQQLKKFLHLPLDSIVMRNIKIHFQVEWEKHVVTAYEAVREIFKRKLMEKGEEVKDSNLSNIISPKNFSLGRIIFEGMYYAWQRCARAIYPEKPVLLDVMWSLNRKI